jgi:endonuclease/exonuclease/phosphatase family metal-dependent hydrolase
MYRFLIVLFILISQAIAGNIKIMNFNTMCDFCKGSDYLNYDKRAVQLNQTISRHSPDLISLQEVRSNNHLKLILKDMDQYEFISSDYLFLSYADPTIVINKKKFQKLESGQFWLGPNEGNFSLGWKFSLPRQVHWVKLKFKHKINEPKEFIFISSHFDNRLENLDGAAEMVNTFLKKEKVPFIFAADTNMTIDMGEYKKLTSDLFINAFDIKENFSVVGKYESDKDICYARKGKIFPECRVDHILLSKRHKWSVKEFIVDATRVEDDKFPSDHRAIISTIQMIE